jgi:thioredoxin-related protein
MRTYTPNDHLLITQRPIAVPSTKKGPAARAGALLAAIIGLSGPAIAELSSHAPSVESDNGASTSTLAGRSDPVQQDGESELALLAAVEAQRQPAVLRLLTAGADPDRANRFGESSLHIAASGDVAIVQSLLDAGANPNARDAGGVTPLMLAAGAGRDETVTLLRGAGARLDMKDYQGSSVRDWALRGGHGELAKRLDASAAEAVVPEPGAGSGIEFTEDVFVDVQLPDWFKISFLDLGDDLEEALEDGKQGILLFISAARCSYCKAFMGTSLKAPDIRRRLTASFDIIGLDIFDDRELTTVDGRQFRVKEFVLHNRASNTPTLIFLGQQGRVLARIVGYYPPDRFRNVLAYLEAKAYRHESLGEYLQRAREATDGGGRPIIADDLFSKPPHMLDRSRMPAQRPLLVVFERPGCDACERFHRRVLGDKPVRRLIGEYEAVQLDASDEHGRVVTPNGDKTTPAAWYRRLGLSYQPAVLFFDQQGKEIMRIDSETQRFRMEGSLQLVLEGANPEDAQLQRWRRTKAIERFQRREDD